MNFNFILESSSVVLHTKDHVICQSLYISFVIKILRYLLAIIIISVNMHVSVKAKCN